MNVTNRVSSWDKKTNKDCFNNGGEPTFDHIWPISQGGSNGQINRQILSKKSNEEKGNETSGVIGEYRFSIDMKTTKKDANGNQQTYGIMHIRKDNWENDTWWEVIPVK